MVGPALPTLPSFDRFSRLSDLIAFMPDPRSEDTMSFSEPGEEEEEEEERGAHERRAARRGKGGRRNRSEEVHQGWRGNGLATRSATRRKAMNE